MQSFAQGHANGLRRSLELACPPPVPMTSTRMPCSPLGCQG